MSSPNVDRYRFGEIVIDGRRYSKDVIIFPEGIDDNWWRAKGHVLLPWDIQPVLQAHPEVLIVGCGSAGRLQVLPETEEVLRGAGIEIIVARTGPACDAYNRLREGKRVVAALHLTC